MARDTRDYYDDTDYNYASAESLYKRIGRLTDYHAIAQACEAAVDKGKYDIHIRESGLQMVITIAPVVRTS